MTARGRVVLSLAALAVCALTVGLSTASFTDTSQNPQTVSAVADFLAPSAGASVVAKAQGGVAGYVKKGGTYYVYASVTESGNPASGVASAKADVSALTSGQTAVNLVAGSYSVDGDSYNYRSAQLTAGASLSAGSKPYSLALADATGNSRVQSFAATVDNGPFAGSDFETADAPGGTSGKAEKGDTVSFAFSKAPTPTRSSPAGTAAAPGRSRSRSPTAPPTTSSASAAPRSAASACRATTRPRAGRRASPAPASR